MSTAGGGSLFRHPLTERRDESISTVTGSQVTGLEADAPASPSTMMCEHAKLVSQPKDRTPQGGPLPDLRPTGVSVQDVQGVSRTSPSGQGSQAVAPGRPEIPAAAGAPGPQALRVDYRGRVAGGPGIDSHDRSRQSTKPGQGHAG